MPTPMDATCAPAAEEEVEVELEDKLEPEPDAKEVWYLLIDHKKKPLGESGRVHVPHDSTVSALKHKVKDRNPNVLGKVDAAQLIVWRCKDRNIGKGRTEVLKNGIKNFNFSEESNDVEHVDPRDTVAELSLASDETLIVQITAIGSQDHDTPQGSATPFNAAGYELVEEPLLFIQRDNIYGVRQTGRDGACIAKRLRADSKELEILEKLRKEQPRCENIIDLIDVVDSSVGKCIILPFLGNVAYSLLLGSEGKLHGRYIRASRDVALGVAFLHEHGIAHMDIKPANLLYTSTYVVKIIDFDVSVQVKDEEEQVTGFFMTFLEEHQGDDEGLKLFASRLLSNDPNERPQLRDWCEREARTMDRDDEATASEGKTLVAEENVMEMADEKTGNRPLKRFRPTVDAFPEPHFVPVSAMIIQ
ncbi:kinase-like domain-containing protein [Phellopilus nigrolimitatus]|nr:kinase-like domain-containing protein [Phellopilus nigrolimitatus]